MLGAERASSGVNRDDYDRLAAINWSSLKHMLKSPAHFRYASLQEQTDTDAMVLGRCVHLATLEPERFRREVAIWDGGTRRGKDWEEFKRANAGREILKPEPAALAKAIGEAARAAAGPLLAHGKTEVTLQWTHLNGLAAKGRVDFISDEFGIVDLKTCRSAAPHDFSSASARMLYHCQAAYYCDGFELAEKKRVPYTIVAVETTAPFVTAIYQLGEDVLQVGTETYQPLLDLLKSCREQSHWPGYNTQPLVLPKWLQPDESDDGMGLTGSGF